MLVVRFLVTLRKLVCLDLNESSAENVARMKVKLLKRYHKTVQYY